MNTSIWRRHDPLEDVPKFPLNHCTRCGVDVFDDGVREHEVWHDEIQKALVYLATLPQR